MRVRFALLVLWLAAALPSIAWARSASSPEAQLRAAIDGLRKSYTLVISDPDYDVEQLKHSVDFTGVSAWSYTGERSGYGITLNWRFEWYDAHAVLAAYRDPKLYVRLNAGQRKLADACAQIMAALIEPEMSEYDKVLAIHDYIVLHCQYDETTALARNTTDNTPFTAYGALVAGRAVCQGYAEAAHILFEMAGIENYQLESADHVWNLVKIGDGYYHLDITWDDPVGNAPDAVRYDYFNLTDAQMARYPQHDWFDRDRYPKADATAFNYFVYNKRVADNYTALKRLIITALKAGQKEISLWVAEDTARAYDWPRDLAFVFDYAKRFQYVPPEGPHRVLTLYVE